MTKEKYLQKKREIDAELSRFQTEIEIPQKENISGKVEYRIVHSELEHLCELFRKETALTYDMAYAFIDRILVYPNERIEIEWRFKDFFAENG